MPVHSKLEKFEDNWQTSMGGWSLEGKVVLRGKDVFTELSDKPWMEYLLYAVTGKESPKIARLMEAMWVICTSFPDPRIWNNRVSLHWRVLPDPQAHLAAGCFGRGNRGHSLWVKAN